MFFKLQTLLHQSIQQLSKVAIMIVFLKYLAPLTLLILPSFFIQAQQGSSVIKLIVVAFEKYLCLSTNKEASILLCLTFIFCQIRAESAAGFLRNKASQLYKHIYLFYE